MFGAQVTAEGGSIEIGKECIILENAVLRATKRHSLKIGDNCLIGPNAHVVGCTVEDEVFIATGSAIFHGAHLERESEVRIHGVVHVKSRLKKGVSLPIAHIAVGDPAEMFPPDKHELIWEIQKTLNFPLTVYGLDRFEANMKNITRRFSEVLYKHVEDEIES